MFRLFTFFSICACAALAADPIVLIPEALVLDGVHARQRLLVERQNAGQLTGDVTTAARLISSDPSVVRIEAGVAIPGADGAAMITASFGESTASATVTVRGQTQPAVISFRNHIQPILAKSGCSLGACHGAAAGQGGFRLSLRGYDDEGDFLSLTRAAMGRRITPGDPARSLILVKPTGAVPHKGGEKFKVGSAEYQTLVDWIANGTPGPQPNDARIQRLELLPSNVVLQPGAKQQVLVRAHFSNGKVEDVTRFAKYTATNQSVATIGEFGEVSVIGNGESAVTAWYLSQIAVGTITAPFPHEVADAAWSAAPRRNWIDDLVLEKLRALRLAPSASCSDSEFIRRASIDTCGVLPTGLETRAFLADTAPDKRDRLIDRLLARPEFVDYWSYKWSDLLLVTKRKVKPAAMWAYYQWIREQVATNTPWDEFARRLITAQGSTLENGAANYFVIHPDPRELAETTSLTFLGVSVNCAKCHNHPMEKWTNNDYYGFANLFSRVRLKNGNGEGDNVIFANAQGDLVQPLTGLPQAPRPLDGTAVPLDQPGDRREPLAVWLTSKENPYFAKAIVNRLWANFFGLGLVENIDDIRATNPASNERLFTTAAVRLGELGFDLKALMREILQSATYQRSSTPTPENQADTRFYARYYPRRLMAEVMQDAIAQVTGVPTIFKTKDPTVEGDKALPFPAGWRALQLPDSNTDSYFTKAFGRPLRDATCECERTAEPSVTQALHIANGDTINEKLTAKAGVLTTSIGKSPEQALDDAYLSALSRPPSTPERTRFLDLLGNTPEPERRACLEDLYWALLSSREFLFNH